MNTLIEFLSSSRLCGLARGCFLFFFIITPLQAQKNAAVPDSDPELERKSFIVAPGFEVNLFAADPMLAKPIQMNWDAQGRLWVACSETYPQIKPGQVANDKIVILEDTKGTGTADKVTVFADGLLIPTGVLPGDGGAYVANSTEILHLSASKPGGKADKRRVVLSGFGTEDTHHIIHTFRWGPDGAMYFNQSVYIHSHVETPHGVQRLNGGGIWRYEPKSQKLSVFARGFWNPWGHAFDKYGNSFATDGAGSIGIAHVFPGACFPTGGNQAPRVLPGLNPGSPKYCGLEIISGRHFPDDWQGDCITNDFRGHRVCRFKLRDDGSTFESREMTEVIKTSHGAFRPIDVQMGPDGALYIADWYNPIIQHGEVDFRDPRRDTTHGRIWRVTAKGRPLVEKPKLVDLSYDELKRFRDSPEGWTRNMAKLRQRELIDHSTELIVESTQVIDPAIQLISDNPRDRLYALRALAQTKTRESAEYVLKVLDKPMDPTLEYALWLTLRELEPYWMPDFVAGKLDFGGDVRKLTFAVTAAANPDAVTPVLRLIDSGKVVKENLHALYLLVARIGGPEELGRVLTVLNNKNDFTEAERTMLIEAVEQAVRARKVGRPKQVGVILNLSASNQRPVGRAATRLIGLWKLDPYRGNLETYAVYMEKRTVEDRAAAIEALALMGDDKAKAFLTKLCDAKHTAEVRRLAITALVGLDADTAATKAVDFLTTADTTGDLRDLFAAFVNRKGTAAKLTKALDGKKLPLDVAKVGVRVVKASSAQDSGPLLAAITKAGSLGVAKKEPTPEEVKTLTADAMAKGDAARGEAIYRRKELQCMTCHAIGGAGGVVGPDLASIGASAQPDYLLESLLIPNKAIKEGFHTLDIVKADGKLISGVKVRESAKELVLRDKDDKEVTIAIEDIESRKNGRSLMPDGATDVLTQQELFDLTKFLSVLGKVGAYEPRKERYVRKWEVIEPTPENLTLFRRSRIALAAEQGNTLAWTVMYSKVDGTMPMDDVQPFTVWKEAGPQRVMRFRLNATAAGAVKLKLNDVEGLTLYANGKPLSVSKETVVDVALGETIITAIFDRKMQFVPRTIELDDVKDSPARVTVVNGK